MRLRGSSLYLRGISLVFILLTAVVTILEVVQYSVSRYNYPAGMTIGNVAVGGLDPQAAAQRLFQVYALPIEIHYGNAVIDLDPALIGFQLNTDSMLAAADLQRTGASFWGGFWDYIWNRHPPTSKIPLVSSFSEARLRAYLINEISARYDMPPTPAEPIPGTATFSAGTPGRTMDIDRAVALIDSAMQSSTDRTVVISSQSTAAVRPSLTTLQILLSQLIDESSFDGLIGIYMHDLQTQETIHFATQAGVNVSINPDIAFSGASSIKIPIMVSVFVHFNSQISPDIDSLLIEMFRSQTGNPPADSLMAALDTGRGPIVVTETMQKLGIENTFSAMYFAIGSIPLQHYITPANSRQDISADPDPFDQTTPSDMGMLLEDIYQCSQTGGGSLLAAFPGQINQAACQKMIQYMEMDKLGALIQGGVPEGTIVAHKHGFTINDFSDAGIIYTPGGNYILTIYLYHPVQAIWGIVSPLFAELSRAVYNYLNLPSQ